MRARDAIEKTRAVAPGVASRRRCAGGSRGSARRAARPRLALVTDLLLDARAAASCSCWSRSSPPGVPLPGETALIAAGVLAAQRPLPRIETVIVVAALAAIIGDNVGYWLGRKGGRGLLAADADRPRRTSSARCRPSERFFARHGAEDGVHRPFRRVPPRHVGVARRNQPHAVVALLVLECRRRNRLGDASSASSHTSSARPPPTRSANTGSTAAIAVVVVIVLAFIGFGSGRSDCSRMRER